MGDLRGQDKEKLSQSLQRYERQDAKVMNLFFFFFLSSLYKIYFKILKRFTKTIWKKGAADSKLIYVLSSEKKAREK